MQRAAEARRRQQQFTNKQGQHTSVEVDTTLERDMMSAPDSKYGFQVDKAGYQEFSPARVRTSPKLKMGTYNQSNPGFADPQVVPSEMLYREMNETQRGFVKQVSEALERQAQAQRLPKQKMLERFERSNQNYNQQQLYVIAAHMGVISEKYESTAGKWVVVMPYSRPQDAQEVAYNQKGLSGESAQALQKKQIGTYGNAVVGYEQSNPQVPPAVPTNNKGVIDYTSTKAKRSLMDPRRGDDFIRNARLTQEEIRLEIKRLGALLEHENRGIREGAQKKLNALSSELVSRQARAKMNKAKAEDRARKDSGVAGYASSVSDMYNKDTKKEMEEQAAFNYQRHISLLEEAKAYLSKKQPGSGWS